MAGSSVTLEDKGIKRFLLNIERKSPGGLKTVVNRTTQFGLKTFKTKLPKRTGFLRKSYLSEVTGELSRTIDSPLPYAGIIEHGGRRPAVTAKRGKVLTIPIKKEVLTKTKGQIKKSKLDQLFRLLKKAKGKKEKSTVMETVGIVLSKKAKPGKIKAQRNIERNIQPAVQGRLSREVTRLYNRLGFS